MNELEAIIENIVFQAADGKFCVFRVRQWGGIRYEICKQTLWRFPEASQYNGI